MLIGGIGAEAPPDREPPVGPDATVEVTEGVDPPKADGAVDPGPYPHPDAHTAGPVGPTSTPAARVPLAPHRRMVRSLLIGSTITAAVAVLLVVVLGSKPATSSAGPVAPVGSQAPGFSLPPLTGSVRVDLDSLGQSSRHPVVLNFFASWCTPCQKETPLLAQAAADEQANGGPVRFVGVDVNGPLANALPFVQKAGIAYPVGVDQTFRVTSGLYGLNGLPQTFYINSNGKVLGHTIGAIDAAGLRSWMKKLADGKPAPRPGP